MAYDKNKGYDPELDYSARLLQSDLNPLERAGLEIGRQNKVNDMYGGVEPYMADGTRYSETHDMSDITNYYNIMDGFNKDKPTYDSRYGSDLDAAAKQYLGMNYEDWTKTQSYQDLAERYGKHGMDAMRNTLANVAARTGGLASSYAVNAGNSAYNDYMYRLEEAARNMFDKERADLGDNVALLQNLENTDYGRYMDSMGFWQNDRDYNASAFMGALENQRYEDDRAFNEAQYLGNYGDFSKFEGIYSPEQIESMKKTYGEDRAYELMTRAKALAKGSGSSGSRGSSGSGGGSGSGYDDLFADALASGTPESFIANNYKKYGFSSKTGLYNEYKDWANKNPGSFGGDLSKAKSWLKDNGYDTSGMFTKGEWQKRKAAGSKSAAIAGYETYEEYLDAYVDYLING